MAGCPKCGTQVAAPQKTWSMAGRPDESGFRLVLSVGLFSCPKCKSLFRQVLSRTRQPVAGAAGLITCPNCGHTNAKDRDYCSNCGTLFSDKWT